MGAADKGKKLKLADRADGDDSDHIDGELMHSVERLQEIQDELEKINEEANEKVLEVEQKYNEIRRPTYKKRNEIIQAIPDFWLTAFLSHPAITDLITEEDQKVLKYMVSLDVEDFKEDKPGYSITFNFATNPYFEDAKLTKTLLFSDEGSVDITGTKIKWKEGKDITKGVAQEKKGKKRPLSEESFFSWFSEDDDNSSLEGVFDMVAEIIKEDLWPNPLRYFNNEIDQEDSDEEEDGEGKANGECESSEEDDDEEEDGDEDEDDS